MEVFSWHEGLGKWIEIANVRDLLAPIPYTALHMTGAAAHVDFSSLLFSACLGGTAAMAVQRNSNLATRSEHHCNSEILCDARPIKEEPSRRKACTCKC
jgi:hypothetical protein